MSGVKEKDPILEAATFGKNDGTHKVKVDKPEDLLEKMLELNSIDDVDPKEEGRNLVLFYPNLGSKPREIADNVLIYITGYTLDSVLDKFGAKFDDVISTIMELYQDNDLDTKKESLRLVEYYQRLPDNEKQIADNVMIHLTGYRIKTILEGEE